MDTTTSSLSSRSWRGLRRLLFGTLVAGAAVAAAAMPHDRGGPGPGMMMGPRLDRVLADVGASDAQRSQVRQIAEAARTELRAQHEAGRSLRQQMMQAFTQPTVDAGAVEALRQKMLAQHDAASRRMTQAMLDISRVLTPEQRARLAERMQQRMDMMRRHQDERRQFDGAAPRQ